MHVPGRSGDAQGTAATGLALDPQSVDRRKQKLRRALRQAHEPRSEDRTQTLLRPIGFVFEPGIDLAPVAAGGTEAWLACLRRFGRDT